MSAKRVSLINYDLLRELCDHCRRERFHFVPMGAATEPGRCNHCGNHGKIADMSDSAVFRLVMQPNGEMKVVPLIAKSA